MFVVLHQASEASKVTDHVSACPLLVSTERRALSQLLKYIMHDHAEVTLRVNAPVQSGQSALLSKQYTYNSPLYRSPPNP